MVNAVDKAIFPVFPSICHIFTKIAKLGPSLLLFEKNWHV